VHTPSSLTLASWRAHVQLVQVALTLVCRRAAHDLAWLRETNL
jgi:hypothetical protein